MEWTEEHDEMTGRVCRYVTNPRIGHQGRITPIFVGENSRPAFQYAAQVGRRSISDIVYDLDAAKRGAENGIILLSAAEKKARSGS